MSYFEKVVDFNTQFGVKLHSTPQPGIFDAEPNNVEFCMKLIREEIKELEDGVKTKDIVETADAIADSIYVLLGMSARIGVNMDEVFRVVHENNMSKLCKTEADAKESVKYYLAHPEMGYDTPAYRKAVDNIHWVVYNESTKKILKSVKWIPVDLTFLLNQ
jgi:hypothetical protein